MVGSFEGKVALVTGAGSGMGRASARAFAGEGASVVVADVDAEGGERTVSEVREAGGKAVFVQTDVSSAEDVEAMVETAVETFGRLDYAHNNAGIEREALPTADSTEEHWDRAIAVNLKGVWLCMKYEIPKMLEAGGGSIVNTSSTLGLIGMANAPAYVASKHGVVGLTRAAALDYARRGIRVNAVCPGVVRTPMMERGLRESPGFGEEVFAMIVPVGRIGTSEEVAKTVVWLCSEAASYVTGVPVPVDGGLDAQWTPAPPSD